MAKIEKTKTKTKTVKPKAEEKPVEVLPTDDGLTNKQRLFISFYLESLNATQSARLAGYQGNYKTLSVVGSENLAKPCIKARVEELMKEKAMPADEVLARLTRFARGSLEPFLYIGEIVKGEAPKLDLSTEQARDNIDLVKELKTKTITKINKEEDGGAIEIIEVEMKLHDAQSALEKLGKHHKLFTDRTEVTGKDGAPIEVKAIDYRTAIAAITARSNDDCDASGEN